jgi:hypothetical protein
MAIDENSYSPMDVQAGLRRIQPDAPYGSIAQRNDPTQYNSILARKYPQIFGQFGAANPLYQQNLENNRASALRASAPLTPGGSLRRPMSSAGMMPWQWQQAQTYLGRLTNSQADSDPTDDGDYRGY